MVKKVAFLLCLVFLLALLLPVAMVTPALAENSYCDHGTAVVDGDYSEWDLDANLFAEMHRAWKDSKPLEANLYLRYGCDSTTLYALVLCVPGVTVDTSNYQDMYIKITDLGGDPLVNGGSGNDGTPPDFEYISEGGQIIGWEASIYLDPGSYEGLIVHTEVNDGGSQTSGTVGQEIPLDIVCGDDPPPPVPETSTIILLGSGLLVMCVIAGFVWYRMRRSNAVA